MKKEKEITVVKKPPKTEAQAQAQAQSEPITEKSKYERLLEKDLRGYTSYKRYGTAERKIKQWNDNKVDFYVIESHSITKMKREDTKQVYTFMGLSREVLEKPIDKHIRELRYTYKEMANQQRLKAEIKRNIISKNIVVPNFTEKDIKYSMYADFVTSKEVFETVFDGKEYDITKAYFQGIRNLGYISQELYEEFVMLPKHVRLRFIGSIATRKFIYHYKDGGLTNEPPVVKEDALLRRVWFHVCKLVDDCLQDFAKEAGEDFIFYYVDGIYLKKANKEVLERISSRHGFDFKTANVTHIKKVHLKKEKADCLMVCKYDADKGEFREKPFYLKKEKEDVNGEYKQIKVEY